MKKTYKFWVSASIEVEVNGDKRIHNLLHDSISDEDITPITNPEVHEILKSAAIWNNLEIDWSDIMNLSIHFDK